MLRSVFAAIAVALLLVGCDISSTTTTDAASTIAPGSPADAPSADSLFQVVVTDEAGAPVSDLMVMVRTDLDLDSTSTATYEDGVPSFELGPVAASPADGPATVTYTLTEPGNVRLFLIDREGRALAEFGSGAKQAGTHVATIPFQLYDAANPDTLVTPGGVYFIELDVDDAKALIPAVFTECPFDATTPQLWTWLGTTDSTGAVLLDDRARFPSSYESQPLLEYRDAAGAYTGTFTLEVPVTIVVKDDAGNEVAYPTTIDPDAVNYFEVVWNP
jgi:hypothetical protein